MIWQLLTSGRLGDWPLILSLLRALLEQEPQCSGFLWVHTLTVGIMETACGSPGCSVPAPAQSHVHLEQRMWCHLETDPFLL